MFHFKNPGWADARERKKVLDDYVQKTHVTRFGMVQMPASEKESAVMKHFNEVAGKYDFMNSLLSFGIQHLWKRAAIRALGLRPKDRVLDVCGGTGDLSVLAAQKIGPEGMVALYDINTCMMIQGRKRDRNCHFKGRIGYVQGNAETISFANETFDAAMVGFGIRNVTHPQKALTEMVRTLKPGGKLLCLDFSKPTNAMFRVLYDFYSFNVMPLLDRVMTGSKRAYACLSETIRFFATPDELKEMLERAGLVDVRYQLLTNGIAVIVAGRKPEG